MLYERPLSKLELKAIEAEKLPAFPINLHDIREQVRTILSEVGRYGFFNEYTTHSFDHVLDMIEQAEWIIPKKTFDTMTPGDAMMLVLAIYLHDMGLLISRDEFNNRSSNPQYIKFVATLDLGEREAKEYAAKINALPPEHRERITYEEFVRYTHGDRVQSWIAGVPLDDDGATENIRNVMHSLLDKLELSIRQDLGMLCDSHTKSSIDDTRIFKTSQPYGNDRREWVNLQYIAGILRTVDLLQISRGRAPSVLFKLINPVDPVSQLEWQKQNAVRTVRLQERALLPNGDEDPRHPDTIEIHAYFKEADGFFGLSSFLDYAQNQLQETHSIISKSVRHGVLYEFPWKFISHDGIVADGFMKHSFGFEIDQQRILDLLTGHTLYNDTSVVLRELVQNALDAVRLQRSLDIDEADTAQYEDRYYVKISYDSTSKTLEILDTGTGMSQKDIEEHLLKVGSSRYQDEKFKEAHPEFSSISRFGIGVLSTFMVADEVEIITCAIDEPKARRISLRSVHGRYLIRLLDKVSDRQEIGVWPHGTRVRVRLRSTARLGDVLKLSQRWVLFPRCKVEVQIDDSEPIRVGYLSPKEAIEAYVADESRMFSRKGDEVTVKEETDGDVTLAYAVYRDTLFQDLNFVRISDEISHMDRPSRAAIPVGVCVEGVGVEFNSPGFGEVSVLAIANAVGKDAPKTNVARSALEDTEERGRLLERIYKLYSRHIVQEIERSEARQNNSLTRSVNQAAFLLLPFRSDRVRASDQERLEDALSEVPLLVIENNGLRQKASVSDIEKGDGYWTVEAPLNRSVELFISEAPSNLASTALLQSLGNNVAAYPAGVVICNRGSSSIKDRLDTNFEIEEVVAYDDMRRLDLRWAPKRGREEGWVSSNDLLELLSREDARTWQMIQRNRGERGLGSGRLYQRGVSISPSDLKTTGLDKYGAFSLSGVKYVLPSQPIVNAMRESFTDRSRSGILRSITWFRLLDYLYAYDWDWNSFGIDDVTKLTDFNNDSAFVEMSRINEFLSAVRASSGAYFDPYAWEKRDGA